MGFSQEGLALESGVDRTFVSMLERGIRQPSLSTIFALATALKVVPSDLVADTFVIVQAGKRKRR